MRIIFVTVVIVLSVASVGIAYKLREPGTSTVTVTKTTTSTTTPPTKTDTTPAGFDKQRYSLTDPSSIWVVVNKKRALNPVSYVPKNLVTPNVPLRVPGNESMQVAQQTATGLEKMFAAAKLDGVNLMLSSGYRSYTYQTSLYNGYVQTQGQAVADTQSARPGHSEHQTGFAADIEPTSKKCELDVCFADAPEGKWLAANAYKHGFIIRYTPDKVPVTGYANEPWHLRYVGTDLAAEMHNQKVTTLEEFFNLGAAPGY